MEEPQTETEQLQKRVDRVKTLGLVNNSHNLSPPPNKNQDDGNQIEIIRALSVEPRLQEIFLEVRGLMYNPQEKKFTQIALPIMNMEGAWKLVNVCKKIAQEAEWSNFEPDRIPEYLDHFYTTNLPYFTFWHEDYELDPKDFNYVMTTLKMFILASFYKGKSGKYLNILGRTYSEDLLGKAIAGNENKRTPTLLDNILGRGNKK